MLIRAPPVVKTGQTNHIENIRKYSPPASFAASRAASAARNGASADFPNQTRICEDSTVGSSQYHRTCGKHSHRNFLWLVICVVYVVEILWLSLDKLRENLNYFGCISKILRLQNPISTSSLKRMRNHLRQRTSTDRRKIRTQGGIHWCFWLELTANSTIVAP